MYPTIHLRTFSWSASNLASVTGTLGCGRLLFNVATRSSSKLIPVDSLSESKAGRALVETGHGGPVSTDREFVLAEPDKRLQTITPCILVP